MNIDELIPEFLAGQYIPAVICSAEGGNRLSVLLVITQLL
jgi:hypothetical protein